ncbi:MAG: hypothetical protein CPSOU_1563 [uncultured Paraburkholderia sp.]|nr:MAG: hypothetical protein CPSOU_1563 [uncultured Paraburkholderia sp.]
MQYVKPGYARWSKQRANERVTRICTPPFPMFHACNKIGIMRFHHIGTVLMRLDARAFVQSFHANREGARGRGIRHSDEARIPCAQYVFFTPL